ncbi:MAG: xanthine dehydrogenase family protein molybdopterin-binding subunit [Hyphomicrobiaceae bacterium]|nr:xanthine dehydrogenase family protein molybdopterin-binding subunit [Hyphomicrobiaceae bacterium]
MQEKVGNPPTGAEFNWIGTRPVRPDGIEKVTGRAQYGADFNMTGQLVGLVLRSPHAHAKILSIDVSKALALDGVKAVVTKDDLLEGSTELTAAGEMMVSYRDISRNVMAREKALYEGQAVVAIAATSRAVAKKALKLIDVKYEVLPHVIDEVEAMQPGAPLLHEDLITQGINPPPTKPSNIAKQIEFSLGDIEKGFGAADFIIEREFKTAPVHQGYIEPHACLANVAADGQADLWVTTQGHWVVRAHCARLLGWDISKIRTISSEIGGGFGGKTVVYLEPLALALSKKSGRPVKMVMSRDEIFRASGPTSGATVRVKMGAKNDGSITAGFAELIYQAGAVPGSPVGQGAMAAFAPYDLEHVKIVGLDVVSNRPKVAAYRAPGAPITSFAVESVVDEICQRVGMDPIELRMKNAAKQGTQAAYGPKFGPIGMVETLDATKATEHYNAPLGPNQGRGIASGFWYNIGGQTTVNMSLNEDGTFNLIIGTPDIGGLRASVAMMAAEELGVDYNRIRPTIGDTQQLGYNFLTGGSRACFSSGMAAVEAAREIKAEACRRAAKLWELPEEAVDYDAGWVRPAGDNAGAHEPISINEIGKMAGKTGGAIVGSSKINAQGAAPSFGQHLVDVEVDPDTGKVSIVRFTVIQDAGRAIHPAYVEGQYQGGAVQGIGWALNEEYIYNKEGKLDNASFLDYRIPVASDLPMIDTVIVEVPNPNHPYGVRGVGETAIVPPMAAIANAVAHATGLRFTQLPLSPPRVKKAIDDARAAGDANLKV